jgi:hypothetical protein
MKRLFDFVGDFAFGYLFCLLVNRQEKEILISVAFLAIWRMSMLLYESFFKKDEV